MSLLKKSQDVADNPDHYALGQGFLVSEESNLWALIRTIFRSQNFLHFLFHQVVGIPKRGSEVHNVPALYHDLWTAGVDN